MNSTLSFLFGREMAYKITLLEQALLAINSKHSAYFATIPSRFVAATSEAQPASLAEFVQPRWQAGQPWLEISPALPLAIRAECLASVKQVMAATLPVQYKRRRWTSLFQAPQLEVPHLA